MLSSSSHRLAIPAVALACLGMLQPGIDPVFLTILTSAHGISPDLHGWIVGASQMGMAAGSVITWRWGASFPHIAFSLAALVGAVMSLATAQFAHMGLLLGCRCIYGIMMGVLYTQAISNAAIHRPHGAYGAAFLCQLALSTVIALFLPEVADIAGPKAALATLAAVPVGAFLIANMYHDAVERSDMTAPHLVVADRKPVGLDAWAIAGAALLFICATMMVWTFVGALAADAGLSEDVIGRAVAIGSLAGAATALVVMRERSIIPPPVTGLVGGLFIISPIIATGNGDAIAFVASVVLLNIGSTAIIVRSSGLASSTSNNAIFRRFVACTHALGMILGPMIGSVAITAFGTTGLLCAAISAVASACLLLLLGQRRASIFSLRNAPQESLDEYLTSVQPQA